MRHDGALRLLSVTFTCLLHLTRQRNYTAYVEIPQQRRGFRCGAGVGGPAGSGLRIAGGSDDSGGAGLLQEDGRAVRTCRNGQIPLLLPDCGCAEQSSRPEDIGYASRRFRFHGFASPAGFNTTHTSADCGIRNFSAFETPRSTRFRNPRHNHPQNLIVFPLAT